MTRGYCLLLKDYCSYPILSNFSLPSDYCSLSRVNCSTPMCNSLLPRPIWSSSRCNYHCVVAIAYCVGAIVSLPSASAHCLGAITLLSLKGTIAHYLRAIASLQGTIACCQESNGICSLPRGFSLFLTACLQVTIVHCLRAISPLQGAIALWLKAIAHGLGAIASPVLTYQMYININ